MNWNPTYQVPKDVAAALPAMRPVEALRQGMDATSGGRLAAAANPHRVVQAAESAAEQRRQGFRLGNLGLMIRYEDGNELTEVPSLHPLPNAPEWFAGLCNLHGLLIPVFDLARYLGVARDASARPMLLVVMHGADATGLLIDGMPERLRWTAQQITATGTAPVKLAAHVRTACLIDQRLWFEIDGASLLDALENALAN